MKLGHFWPIFQKCHFGRFADTDHRLQKIRGVREIIFASNFFSGFVFNVPGSMGKPFKSHENDF